MKFVLFEFEVDALGDAEWRTIYLGVGRVNLGAYDSSLLEVGILGGEVTLDLLYMRYWFKKLRRGLDKLRHILRRPPKKRKPEGR